MELNLQQKVFIVSGGSKGIGAAITKTITDEGGIVVIATRSTGSSTDAFIKQLRETGKTVHLVLGDLQDPYKCKQVIHESIQRFGQINGIINNAGFNDGTGLDKGPEAFRKSVGQNLFHYYDLVHFALPWLKKSKGSIVNISSKVALTGQGNTSGYAAAKGAQLALTREWAADLLPYSIRVNAIVPAEVMTPLYRRWLDSSFENPDAKESEIKKRIPLEKRMTTKEEIANVVAFLLSDKSSHTTGQFFIIDGGYVHLDRALT